MERCKRKENVVGDKGQVRKLARSNEMPRRHELPAESLTDITLISITNKASTISLLILPFNSFVYSRVPAHKDKNEHQNILVSHILFSM